MNLIFLFRLLQKRLWLLLGLSCFAAVLTFLLTLNYEDVYRSSAQLATGFTITSPLDEENYNVFEEDVKFSNLIATINSPVVLSMLSYQLILNDLSEGAVFRNPDGRDAIKTINEVDLNKAREVFRQKLENYEVLSTFEAQDRQLLELLEAYEYDQESLTEALQVYRGGQTDYISVFFQSENPQLSAFAVNTLCQEFIRYYNSLQMARTNESVESYKSLLDQKKQLLQTKANSLEQFKSSQGVLNFNVESESKVGQIAQAETALVEERRKASGMQRALSGVQDQIAEVQAQINRRRYPSQSAGQTTNSAIVKLQQQIDVVNQQYVASGMSDRSLLDSLNQLREQRTTLLSFAGSDAPVGELRERLLALQERESQIIVDLAVAQDNVGSIQATLSGMRSSVGTYASREARIGALQREVDLATQEYQDAQEKYSSSLDLSLSSVSRVRQVLYGQPAIKPESSKRLILTGLVGISTFVLGALLIGLLAYIDVTLKNASNFSRLVDLPLVGVVSQIVFDKTNFKRIFSSVLASNERGRDVDSTFKELVRKIRFEMENTEQKAFLFTSAKPQEGKSVLMIALAHTFSLSKKRVLLVDTNFPHHTLTKYFKAPPALEDFIANRTFEIEASKEVFTRTGIPSVDIIGCGGGNFSPMERFPKENIKAFITYVSQYYDYVLLEGPSINKFLDSKELTLFVDRVVGVFSAKSTIRQTDKETVAFFKSLDSKFLGAVLTQVEPEDVDA